MTDSILLCVSFYLVGYYCSFDCLYRNHRLFALGPRAEHPAASVGATRAARAHFNPAVQLPARYVRAHS